MSVAKIMTGPRAILIVNGVPSGIFNSVSYGVDYNVNPAYILGRYSPAELTYVGQEAIQVTATGWRVIDSGPYTNSAAVPRLQDLLTHNDISLAIMDRLNPNKVALTVVGVRPVGYSTQITQKSQQEITVRFMGLRAYDENGSQDETAGATSL